VSSADHNMSAIGVDGQVVVPTTSEDELQALINATAGVSLLIDLEGTIVCANQHSASHFGIPMERLIGTNVYSLFDEATARGRRAIVRQAELQRMPVVLEDERSGMYFRHSLVPAFDAAGVVQRVAVFAENITERKVAQLALQASEAQYRFLAENTADTVWQLNARMCFTFVNGAYPLMTGFDREELMGKPVMDFFTPEGRDIVAGIMKKRQESEAAGLTNVSMRFEVPHIHKTGAPFWVEINSNPIYDASGAISGYNGITRDIHERKQYQHKLEEANRQLQEQLQENVALHAMLTEQTIRDPLTGLHNRRYLEETLPRELSRAKRVGYPMALIMVDLDHFKRVNDTYGHPTGDAVLKAMASILLHGAREGDIICRFGGEEFLVALPNMTVEHALTRAKAWQATLGQTSIQHGAFSVQITLSAGISAFPDHGADIDTLLHLADEALYRAKANGRNRVEFDPPLSQQSSTL
jgi:diguanylate cyclase (GGDEF)-like protein/PAS domain S-box-containing protein